MPQPLPRVAHQGNTPIQTATLSIYHFPSLTARLWAFAQMGLARASLRRVEGLAFWKLLGSGLGEGFTPLPNTAVYAILGAWQSRDAAQTAFAQSPVFRRYAARASAQTTFFLRPISARGEWAAQQPFTPDEAKANGPLAALTRATLKPQILLPFWRRVPSISAMIGADPNVQFKVGLGEVPWLHQVTFSIWPDADTMAAFARTSGPHAEAIKAVRDGKWFREELYARFEVTDQTGHWPGTRLT